MKYQKLHNISSKLKLVLEDEILIPIVLEILLK